MKTPEEIKSGLACCAGGNDDDCCNKCNYKDECLITDGFNALAYDALKYIEKLEVISNVTMPGAPKEET